MFFFSPLVKILFKKNRLNLLSDSLRYKMKLAFSPDLKGMKQLKREMFNLELKVPALKVKKNNFIDLKKFLKNFIFDSINLKKYQDLSPKDPLYSTHKYIILDPEKFNYEKLEPEIIQEISKLAENSEEICSSLTHYLTINLHYEDLKFDDVMKAIIPDEIINENVNVKGYSIIGHIAHFNLRDQVLEYKNIIGEVLLDKVNHIKTVVNKVNEIDNTYRNFKFEILAGEKSTLVQCKENGCDFKFDFAHVYWNPRLGTEHERVVNLFNSDDVVYDIFAGVGPFSVPAVSNQKISACLSNDLNPHSFKYLLENYKNNNKSKNKLKDLETRKTFIKRSKIPEFILPTEQLKFDPNEFFMAFNLDGRDFIRKKLKYHLIEFLNYRQANEFDFTKSKFYALMNLPAMSLDFLDSFTNLYDHDEIDKIKKNLKPELIENFRLDIFCYHFCKGDKIELEKIQERIRQEIYHEPELKIDSKYVRKVAPNKDMYCTMFKIGFKNFFSNGEKSLKNKAIENADINREIKVQKIE